ncbi:hypothetical protein BY458DRAFT_535796 [Sporodiniella umbellata]|nr:hypothetical protein BY458DRAFT_535796 [Sporodiniella umbellata]
MMIMEVKRGHRRLIQREIATAKGIPRNQPLATNMMGPKYTFDATLKMDPPNTNYGYDTMMTGLTSPRSMNSGLGSHTSGNSSSNTSGSNRVVATTESRPSPTTAGANGKAGGYSHGPGVSGSPQGTGGESPDEAPISISSNDDNDSIQSDTTPKRKYRRHAKPDRNAPIKPPSAYIMFSNDSRAQWKEKSLTFTELAKRVGEKWKHLSYPEKKTYERKAMLAKDEYLAALETYRQTDAHRQYQAYLQEFKKRQEESNRMIERARKRAKQKSPSSGSFADASSNGNSTGNGSSGSSADIYGDKDSSTPEKEKSFVDHTATNDYQDVEDYRHQQIQAQENRQRRDYSPQQAWNYRSDQMMRGMIPVEFSPETSILAGQKHPLDDDPDLATKRRSPRFCKSGSES